MKVLLIDNYDSFTYNLYQYVGEILENLETPFVFHVVRNDEKTLDEIKKKITIELLFLQVPEIPKIENTLVYALMYY